MMADLSPATRALIADALAWSQDEVTMAEAYAWLAQSPQGRRFLMDCAERLLGWSDDPNEQGARRYLLVIFELVAQSVKEQHGTGT